MENASPVPPTYSRMWIRCRKCRHTWFPRSTEDYPSRCANPDCRSMAYDQPSLETGAGVPRKHEGGPLYQCQRCVYEWFGRVGQEKPLNCPGCDSPYWQVPRRRGAVGKRAQKRPRGRQQSQRRGGKGH